MKQIDLIWNNIKIHAGEVFYTITGLAFTYEADGDYIKPYRDGKYVGRKLSKKNFENALSFTEYTSKTFSHSIIGSAYVRAILLDKRINFAN